jgi:hypothetical protein
MGTKEHAQVVLDYLRHVGCDSVDGIFLGIGGIGAGASKAGVRAALKRLEAHGRKTGDWRISRAETDAVCERMIANKVPSTCKHGWHYSTQLAHYPGIETLYSLRPWSLAW